MAFSLQHALALLFLCNSCTSEKYVFLSARVGETVTVNCTNPDQNVPQDGVYMYHQLDTDEKKVTYLYKDGTFTPREPFKNRLETNKKLDTFAVSILNLSISDTGVYWCVFNKEDKNYDSKEKTLLVVSGNENCANEEKKKENNTLTLIIVSVGASFLMMFATIILLLIIPKMKRCCEHGNFAPPRRAKDGVYEDMRGRRHPAAHTLINPAYQTSTMHAHKPFTESPYERADPTFRPQ
ncbi:uncharacterized protein LOC108441888 [Pygocentrus nattereri]|uniref:uncharacterized protein LOC108441888 n=1 Tax=Pygocentrus nattereri TaxID=42514 RepID=UPI0008148ABD|nr:uncharacterized protein LOC108441888 [Pygocentrus nattereri]